MKKSVLLVIVTAAVSVITETKSVDDSPLTAEELSWGKCSWETFREYGLEDLQYRMAVDRSDWNNDDYLKWEDFDIRMVSSECGDGPGFGRNPARRYEVLRLTYGK